MGMLQQQRRIEMTHKGKIAAAIIGAVVVVVAAVPLFVNGNTFKPLIEDQLTTAMGRQTKLGDLSLSIFSGTVVARDLQIADDPQFSKQPFVTATEFRIGVQMLPLIFHRQILVNSLEIDTPRSISSTPQAAPGIFRPSAKAPPTARRNRNSNRSCPT